MGRLGASLIVHQRRDSLDVVMRCEGGRSHEVGLVDRAAHQGHAPQGPLLGGLFPRCGVSPRRDLGDAPLPFHVQALAVVEAERLPRRRRRQQGPEGHCHGLYRRERRLGAASWRHHRYCARPGPPRGGPRRRGIHRATKAGLLGWRGSGHLRDAPRCREGDVARGRFHVLLRPEGL